MVISLLGVFIRFALTTVMIEFVSVAAYLLGSHSHLAAWLASAILICAAASWGIFTINTEDFSVDGSSTKDRAGGARIGCVAMGILLMCYTGIAMVPPIESTFALVRLAGINILGGGLLLVLGRSPSLWVLHAPNQRWNAT